MLNKNKARKMFGAALAYCKKNHKDELEWAKGIGPDTFNRLTVKGFLGIYCWVVYASGFKVSTVEAIFPRLKKAYNGFNLESLALMKSPIKALKVFNNKRKANSFLAGCKAIASEGYTTFKQRVKVQGISALEELNGIGPITKFHLAKEIGLIDEAKPDVWLERAAKTCNTTVNELVTYLSKENKMKRNVVDVVLWRYGADKKLGL